MSLRSRIEAFEALSKKSEDSSKDKKNESRKRFRHPGTNNSRGVSDREESLRDFIAMNKTASKTQNLSDFEADLQEVWSVRKNIHHNGSTTGSGTSSSLPSVQVKAGQYSRHGAIPAQQTQGPSVLFPSKESQSKGFSFETKRTPLQEHNSKDTPWNVKTSGYSYNSQDAVRKQDPHPPDEKVSYAKKMAKGYLRSMGMGEYTPKVSGYSKQSQADESHTKPTWKKIDDDFDFNSESKPNPERKIGNEAPRPTDSEKITLATKENQAKGTVDQGAHNKHRDDEGVSESTSKSSDALRPSKVEETATVTRKKADYNNYYDFSTLMGPSSTDKKEVSEVARPSEENRVQEHQHRQTDEKLNYARKMAQGYLKSEGLGVYTPKTSGYVKQSKPTEHAQLNPTSLKKVDNDDEFKSRGKSKSPERKISSENDRPNDEKTKDQQHKTNEKLNYAKRMARGYLKAEGLGEYTPTNKSYVKHTDDSHSHSTWKRLDDEREGSSERKISSDNGLSADELTEKDHQPLPEKINYAKKMAKGYLRSVGMGEYTPPASGYTKQSKSDESHKQSTSTWKNFKVSDNQEFEFDL